MVKLAIAGFGNIGKVHLANLSSMRGCSVVGIFDTNSDAMRTADPSVRRYRDLAELTGDPEVDAVVIATPSNAHAAVVRSALAADKHIFVEKPLAATLAESQEIVDAAAAKKGLRAQAGFCERFNPQYLEAKRAVSSGVLGELRAIQTSRVAPYSLSNPAWDLGVLDTAVHNLDLILWLKGQAPRSVYAFGAQVYSDSDIPHSVTTILRFDDGSIATDQIAWIKDDAHPLHQCARSTMSLQGTRGTFDIDLTSRPSTLLTDESYSQIDSVILGGPEYYSCLKLQFEAFLRSVEDGAAVLAPLDDALLAERVVLAAAESLRTGNQVLL